MASPAKKPVSKNAASSRNNFSATQRQNVKRDSPGPSGRLSRFVFIFPDPAGEDAQAPPRPSHPRSGLRQEADLHAPFCYMADYCYLCPMSYNTSLTYHLVFGTFRRMPVIDPEHEKELYKYMLNYSTARGIYVRRIGGMPDHVHILCDIPAKLP